MMDPSYVLPPLAGKGRLAVTEAEMIDWGERLGRALQPPIVVTLSGELGAGKTTLARAVCRGYGVADEVTSPTFTLVHEYAADRSPVYHVDLYRLSSLADLASIDWDELMARDAVVLVEWPERAQGLLPPGHVPIQLQHLHDDPTRRVLFAGGHT